jgi:hypothetical protein
METKNGEVKKEEAIDPIVKLRRPINRMSGEPLTELTVDIDELDAEALHNIEAEYVALFPSLSPTNGIYMTDSKYQLMVIGRANKLRYEEISKLHARDTVNVTMRFSRFLAEPA